MFGHGLTWVFICMLIVAVVQGDVYISDAEPKRQSDAPEAMEAMAG